MSHDIYVAVFLSFSFYFAYSLAQQVTYGHNFQNSVRALEPYPY